jgi:hypothetical protein
MSLSFGWSTPDCYGEPLDWLFMATVGRGSFYWHACIVILGFDVKLQGLIRSCTK